ncbi:MAG: cation transporter [Alphaproteobacteria bacterium CG1_02_46_17]|nr:MAG: cation transporter [Alphaproteobacteria bacterium CG1_02_46_17]
MNKLSSPYDPSNSFIARIIDWSVGNKFFILLGALIILCSGIYALYKIPLDAIPDLSDTQVIIQTNYSAQSPQIVENQVTFPLSTQMLGLPRTKSVRGFSMFGTSFVYIIFEDGVDMYWARSRVLESLSQVQSELPSGVIPQLGPDATGVGWVFQYALYDRTGHHDLADLRDLQDWFVKFELSAVDGVAEVASVGGYKREYQVYVDPIKLRAFDVSLKRLSDVVRLSSGEVGGRTIEMAESEYLILSKGYIENVNDLSLSVLGVHNGVPVTVGDVARVVEGPALRRGVAELNGVGEVVGGIIVMRPGYNALDVIEKVRQRLDIVRQGLPDGVEIKVVYDRSHLIKESVSFLKHKLIEESLMVALVTILFLMHVRSSLVAIVTLPLGVLGGFTLMYWQGLSANIMSLGGVAIAIGAMVDASIVMVENVHRKLASLPDDASDSQRRDVMISAMKEVGPSLFFSLLIITVSFIPVFSLNGQSEKLFSPLAFTKTYSMAVASLLSVTLVPVLVVLLVKGKIKAEDQNILNRIFLGLYRPILDWALSHRLLTILLSAILLVSSAVPISRTGYEFMPPLYEGGLLYMPMTLPGVSVTKARKILQVTNRQIMTVPEVENVFGKAGRSDSATDPAPLSMIESWIELKPKSEWRTGLTPEKLIAELNDRVGMPGLVDSWGYPIKIRLDMLSTGIRTPVGIKIAGDDLSKIDLIAQDVEQRVRSVSGTRNAIADRVVGGKYIEIVPELHQLARYGVSLSDVQTVISTALGGMKVGETVKGRARYAIMVRYDRGNRENIQDLENILVSTSSGSQIPLSSLASIHVADGPSMIKSEDARLNGWVFVDFGGRDLSGYVKDLKDELNGMDIPQGYSLQVSGEYEQMESAKNRLLIAVPATLLIILVLLYIHFGSWGRTALIFLSLPFGVIGGVWAIWLCGYHFSVAVAVGFIALAGIAAETAIVMLIYIDHEMLDHPPQNIPDLVKNVRHGALNRLRPKMMTVITIVASLVPIFLSDGAGADVMRRIALPMLGGMVSTTILTLVLVPVLYVAYMGRVWKVRN